MGKLLEILFNINTAYAQVGSAAADVKDETQTQLAGILDFIIVKIPSFIAAILVFALFYIISKAIKGIVENRMATAFEEHKEVQILAGRTAGTVTLIIGATVALNIAGIDLTVIIAAAGFGIGFALKDIITNFLAGILILAQKHFTIGDFIQVNGTLGKIVEIQARATVLKAIDGAKVVVPNAELFTNQVKSFTSNPFRKLSIDIGVGYGTDLELAIRTCYAVMQHTKGVLLEPKPVVLVKNWGASNVGMSVWAWVGSKSSWLKIKSNLVASLYKAFNKLGIEISYDRITLNYDKDLQADLKKIREEPEKLPEWLAQVKEKKVLNRRTTTFKPYISQGPSVDRPGSAFLNIQQEIQQIQEQTQTDEQAPETVIQPPQAQSAPQNASQNPPQVPPSA